MPFEIEETEPEKNDETQKTVKGNQFKPLQPLKVVPRSKFWKFAKYTTRVALYLGLVLFVSGKYLVGKFDEKLDIAPEVRRNPIQESISESPFYFDYRNHSYRIEPVASYDISGLVVTHNDISSITDAYHSGDSVDFKDICLVWGANVGSGIFRKFQFWSEPWSCHMKTDDSAAASSLLLNQVSNNHLLTADEKVRKTIQSMRIGDQVRLQGMLINYSPKGQSELVRRTSITREDTGNGACEVLWVDNAQILRRGSSGWYGLKEIGFWLLIFAVGGSAGLFFFAPLREYLPRW